MGKLPRNEVPCAERECSVNCFHCFARTCVVPIEGEIITVVPGEICKHTDETYEAGMIYLEDQPPNGKANTDSLIRREYGIPSDRPITEIHRRNFQAHSMAYIHALMNSPSLPTLF